MHDLKYINKNFKTKKDIKEELKKSNFSDGGLLLHDLDLINYFKRNRITGSTIEKDIKYIQQSIYNNKRTKKTMNIIIDLLYLKYILNFSKNSIGEFIYREIKNNNYIDIFTIKSINDKYLI